MTAKRGFEMKRNEPLEAAVKAVQSVFGDEK